MVSYVVSNVTLKPLFPDLKRLQKISFTTQNAPLGGKLQKCAKRRPFLRPNRTPESSEPAQAEQEDARLGPGPVIDGLGCRNGKGDHFCAGGSSFVCNVLSSLSLAHSLSSAPSGSRDELDDVGIYSFTSFMPN